LDRNAPEKLSKERQEERVEREERKEKTRFFSVKLKWRKARKGEGEFAFVPSDAQTSVHWAIPNEKRGDHCCHLSFEDRGDKHAERSTYCTCSTEKRLKCP